MSALDRPPKSAAEVAALRALGSTQRLAYVRENGPSFAAETLVFLMRVGYAESDSELVEVAARLLFGAPDTSGRLRGGHCEAVIGAIARKSFAADARDAQSEFRQRCLAAALQAIRGGADSGHFWEERFFAAFKMRCIDVRRALDSEEQRAVLGSELDDDGDDWQASLPDPNGDETGVALHRQLRVERNEALQRAVLALPPRQRIAVQLRFYVELPIAGSADRTVCKIMGIKEANVHKLLNKALDRLRQDPALALLWRDGS